MGQISDKEKWRRISEQGYKKYFWTRFPFLFVIFSSLFLFFEYDILDRQFADLEDFGAILFYHFLVSCLCAFLLNMNWRLNNKTNK